MKIEKENWREYVEISNYEKSIQCFMSEFYIKRLQLYNDTLVDYTICSKNDDERMLNKIVYEGRKRLCIEMGIEPVKNINFPTRQCCGIACWSVNDIIKEIPNIKSTMITTNHTLGIPENAHAFTVLILNNKKYLIDFTYSQFLELYFMSLESMKIPKYLNAMPGYFMTLDDKKINLLNKIIKYGWFEATEENLKMYLDSFVLSSRNAYFYLNNTNNSIVTTEFDEKFYSTIINNYMDMVNRKKLEINKYQHINFFDDRIFGKERETNKIFDEYLNDEELRFIDVKIEKTKKYIKE